MSTSESAIVKKPVLRAIIQRKDELRARLPQSMDVEKFTMSVATAMQKNPALLDCSPQSIMLACYDAAEMGISLSPALQLGYLVPYKQFCQFQVGYRGLIQKVRETGSVRAFFAEVVYENDGFNRQFAPKRNLFHAPAEGERGEPIGAYAFVEYQDGSTDWEYMPKEEILKRRNVSRAWQKDGENSLLWGKFWQEGWRKTPIRSLFKRMPLSSPKMEALAEVVEREAGADAEPEPAGRLELEPDSPLSAPPTPQVAGKPSEIATARDPEAKPVVFFQVGNDITTVSGRTILLKDELPKVGARWDKSAGVWTMPAGRTHELLAVCDQKGIPVAEVGSEKPKEPELF